MSYILFYKKDNTIKQVNINDVIDDLYFLKATVPTKENITKYIKSGKNAKIIKYLKSKSSLDIISDIKKNISKISNKIPLYDEYTKNTYIITKENVYERVTRQYYRFPNKELIELFKDRKNELEPQIKNNKIVNKEKNLSEFDDSSKIHYDVVHKTVKIQREYHKLELMLEFLGSFDIDVLQTTYIKIFYFYANEVGKNITECTRPSFLPHFTHIKPYYSRSELINLALNMELIKPSNQFYDHAEVMKLCHLVKENDISADTILKHQEYIIKNNKIGIIQYYSLQGSYFMNQYMRNLIGYEYKNELYEEIIKSMWNLIINAPGFDKSYTVYRFIHNDTYLRHLSIGDVFIDPAFISTTRDPFYRSEVYKFGFILVKIKIPANVPGIGLCVESYSHFPEEQEIVLAPLSKLKLIKKDENTPYYHTDDHYESQIATKYEFEYIGKEPIKIESRPTITENYVDFLNLEIPDVMTTYEKIKQFLAKNVNEIHQFKTKIGNNDINLMVEWYDSTSAYKNFYAANTNNGFLIYTIKNNYITFFIEIGEDDNETYMYVNYYFKYASNSKDKTISDIDFIEFLCKIGYYFGIRNIILYTEYISCDIDRQINHENGIYHGGNYCQDFYRYLKFKEKRFQNKDVTIDKIELKPYFSYYELDRLRTIDPDSILKKDDRDEIYQIYKTYKTYFDNKQYNVADFYVWIAEHHCVHLHLLVNKMDRIYSVNNPFTSDFYVLDSSTYLYNHNLIPELPILKNSVKQSFKMNNDRVPKNGYRLDYRKLRV